MSRSTLDLIEHIRGASRVMVRELGFMQPRLAASDYPPSSVHTLVEIGERGSLTAGELVTLLGLEKSSVSRLVRKLIDAGELQECANEEDARSKSLRLTPRGLNTLAGIEAFARRQVGDAIGGLTREQQQVVRSGLEQYAVALQGQRIGASSWPAGRYSLVRGYRPGIIGRIAQMHAEYYARHANFGQPFESLVASDMAELMGRLANPCNEVWTVLDAGHIVGSIAIDGEGENGEAILRCFILDPSAQGHGLGKRLLHEALAFCDEQAFSAVRLWTFKGLDVARALYEKAGFVLACEQPGQQWGEQVIEQCFVRPGRPHPQA